VWMDGWAKRIQVGAPGEYESPATPCGLALWRERQAHRRATLTLAAATTAALKAEPEEEEAAEATAAERLAARKERLTAAAAALEGIDAPALDELTSFAQAPRCCAPLLRAVAMLAGGCTAEQVADWEAQKAAATFSLLESAKAFDASALVQSKAARAAAQACVRVVQMEEAGREAAAAAVLLRWLKAAVAVNAAAVAVAEAEAEAKGEVLPRSAYERAEEEGVAAAVGEA
jgi:hypothetical protein